MSLNMFLTENLKQLNKEMISFKDTNGAWPTNISVPHSYREDIQDFFHGHPDAKKDTIERNGTTITYNDDPTDETITVS